MSQNHPEMLQLLPCPPLERATLVLALSGWMDGGDVSTGTVNRLVHLLDAQPIAHLDPEPFFIVNFPGSMEIAALFRPHVVIEDGLIKSFEMPVNTFSVYPAANLVLFVGREPNLHWRTFGECIFSLAHKINIRRIVFVGSFGGTVPHTREPRLFLSASDAALLQEMKPYGLRLSSYRGPGSFTTYLMTQAESEGLEMVSLVAEIPSYLQGPNLQSIEAVTRRLAKILKLPLDLATLRAASTQWELQVSSIVEEDKDLANTVHELETAYDNELLKEDSDEN